MNSESPPHRTSVPNPSETDDAELMRRVTARDHQAFEEIYRRYAPTLLRYLSRFLTQRDQVEEILNDVMLILWQKAAQFDPSRRLHTWLLGIARLEALMMLRSTKAKSEYPPTSLNDPTLSPQTLAAQNELSQAVTKAVTALPIAQREIVELAFYHGLSYREISAVLGCPVGTVKTRMVKARQLLRPLLTSRT